MFANWTRGCDGRDACSGAEELISTLQADASALVADGRRRLAAKPSKTASFTGYRGFVFGGPDEWSSPYYRLDSAGARTSLQNLISIGGNAVEGVALCAARAIAQTNLLRCAQLSHSGTSPMSPTTRCTLSRTCRCDRCCCEAVAQAHTVDQTESNADIHGRRAAELHRIRPVAWDAGNSQVREGVDRCRAFVRHARGCSPMLDPDWTLPSQYGTRLGTVDCTSSVLRGASYCRLS